MKSDLTDLRGKTALITGGSKGIGLGIAEAMASVGMRVAISSRNGAEAEVAANRLIEIGAADAFGMACDVRNWNAQQELANAMGERWGAIDVVIANAGVGSFGPIDTLPHDSWHDMIDTNLTGVFYSLQATVEWLKKSKGYYITIASLAGTNFFANGAAYNASKFGVVGFTQAAMLDLRPYNIKVSTIMPGSVATYFNGHIPNDSDAWKIQPEDIGQLVIDLLQMHPRTLPSKIEVRPSKPA